MRILIGTDTYYPNVDGVSSFTQKLAQGLKKRGHLVLIIAPAQKFKQGFYTHNGIKVYGIPSVPSPFYKGFRISTPFFSQDTLEKIVSQFKPDIIHIQGHFFISRSILSIAKKLNIRILGTNHFMPETLVHYLHLSKFLEQKAVKWAWNNFNSIFEKLDAVTVPTKTAAELMKKNGFLKPIIVISNGIDLRKYTNKNKDVSLKKKYLISNKPLLLYTGRIAKEKNIESILKALPLVRKKNDMQFIVAGGGSEEKNIKDIVKKIRIEDITIFLGILPTKDLQNLYKLADCFIIASTVELQSQVTMEAMASGLPVLAANAMALPELVKHCKNGFLFKPHDIESISMHIIKILSNKSLRIRMAKKSLQIIKKHDINNTIRKFEILYKSLRLG